MNIGFQEIKQMNQNESISIVVIGAAGQGKSSLINIIMNQQIATTGDKIDGVTKNITQYKTQLGQNMEVVLYDLPGFGDVDIGVEELTEQWNSTLQNKKIDLIFFCQQISYCRMDSITRVGLDVMTNSLKNPMIEKTFVIVITQIDLKSQEEIAQYNIEFVQKQLIPTLKQLINASQINQIIYSSIKENKKTRDEVENICNKYLNENKILRIGLLGESQSGKTTFISQFLEKKIQTQLLIQQQKPMLESYLTNYSINGLQIEFVEILFNKDISQVNFRQEWIQLFRAKKLNLLFVFINQDDQNIEVLSENHLQKYQDIVENKQLNESYCILINPSNQLSSNIMQKKIKDLLKKNKISVPQQNQQILNFQDINAFQSNFNQCINLYENARKELKNTRINSITKQIIFEAQERAQKKGGKQCISLTGRVLTDNGYVKISKLQEGQIIMVQQYGRLNTDKIIAFIHKNHKESNKFIKIIFQNQEFITLTPNHLLKVYGQSFIQSKFVRIGDHIERNDGYVQYPDQVIEVQHVYEEGFSCPLSISGQLIVNGCVVSCYSNCSQRQGDIFTWPIRNIQMIRNIFKQDDDSEQIHPYFRFLLSINKRLKLVNEEL